MLIKSVDDLNIYSLALQLSLEIVAVVNNVPYHWGIPEIKQVIRSTSSVHANIAEGFAQRFYPKKFILYLNIALGSSDESKNHIKKLSLNKHINPPIGNELIKKYKDLSIKILNLINHLRKRNEL